MASAPGLIGNGVGNPVDRVGRAFAASEFVNDDGEDIDLAELPQTARHLSELSANAALRVGIEPQKGDQLAQAP